MNGNRREVTIIGAGIVGICCARWLQRDGHKVRVLDPLPPGHGCSWGNAGVLASDSVIPLSTPQTLCAIPAMLARPDQGVVLRWQYLPRMLPWLARFVANARPRRVQAVIDALAALCQRADADYRPLLVDRPAGKLLRYTGWVTAFETGKAFDGARWALEQRRARGIGAESLDTTALRERVPELAEHVTGGLHFPDAAMCVDPAGLVARLADDVVAHGGRIEQVRVDRLRPGGERVRIETAAGAVDADHVVIAAGAWSGALARDLGERFPLDTERGYHAMIRDAGIAPAVPVMSGEYRFVTTTMSAGLRMAGTTELAGMRRPPDYERARMIMHHGRRLFPGVRTDAWSEWMGFRPTLPDSLPVIGRSPSVPAVTYAFGHQHLGLTLGGVTGRMVADDLAGRAPVVDPAAFSPRRFVAGGSR